MNTREFIVRLVKIGATVYMIERLLRRDHMSKTIN